MWFGLEFPDPAIGGKAVIHAYEPVRVMRVRAAPEDLPLILLLLRDAARENGSAEEPWCPACGALLDLPPPDALVDPCVSA